MLGSVQETLKYNANTFIKNNLGKTPFSLAKEKELYEVIEIFKQNIHTLTFENKYPSKRTKSFCVQEQLIYSLSNFFSFIFIRHTPLTFVSTGNRNAFFFGILFRYFCSTFKNFHNQILFSVIVIPEKIRNSHKEESNSINNNGNNNYISP